MSGEERPLLALLDGHGIIHRSYHAMREQPLTLRRTGEVITAAFGFANTLLSVLQEMKPTHVAVTLDKGSDTFRRRWDASYKAHRVEMPDDLREQMGRCRQLIEAFGMPIYEHEGYEADDMLGTLSRQASQAGADTFLVSLDSDIAQLVEPGVRLWMYRPYQRDSVIYASEEDVNSRYGVYPRQLPDLKALKGDPSDNIAGVPGVGDKTAAKLVQQFGSVEGVYENIEKVAPPKLRQALMDAEPRVRQNKVLATIVRDAPVQIDLAACDFAAHYQRERVLALFRELEFRSLVPRLPQVEQRPEQQALWSAPSAGSGQALEAGPPPGRAGSEPKAVAERYQVVRTEEELEALARRIEAVRAFAFDTETTGLEAMRARLVGVSIALAPGEAYYLPLGHRTDQGQLPLALAVARLGPLLADEAIEKTGHNAKYDILVLAREGVRTGGLRFDTMIAAFLVGESAIGLKWLASRRLGIEMTPITDLIGQGRNQIPMSEVDIEAAARYACADADMTGRLRTLLEEELKQEGMWHLFSQVEMPLVPVLAKMEMNGVALDTGALREMSVQLTQEIGRLEEEIHRSVGHSFNIGSPQQLSHVLFEELRLPKTRRLKSGGYTTDAQALEGLRGLHDVIDLLFQWRELSKLKSTYLDTLPGLINPDTNRVHTEFNQAGAATGRLSSSNPNLQNIPVRTEMGGQVRRAFVARDVGPDPWLLSADYSQIELRIMAHITEDPALMDAFLKDEDIHAATASEVFGVALDEVTPEMRRRAKVFNFGVLYGLTDYGLSVRERIPREEAAEFIQRYFAKYPGIKRYMEETVQRTREQGYAETLLGRRRPILEINSSNFNVRQAAERAAINMPVQGTAADIIKIAMNRIDAEMERRRLRSLMTIQVHDELIFESPREELEEVRALALDIMPKAMELKVHLKVDTKVGKSWDEME